MRDPDFARRRLLRTRHARPDRGLVGGPDDGAHHLPVRASPCSAKFGRDAARDAAALGFDVDFEVETYLDHQGDTFLDRFDANTYLYLTRVMDYFDPFAETPPRRRRAGAATRFLVLSFDYRLAVRDRPLARIVERSRRRAGRCTFREIASPHGHDSFLLALPDYHAAVAEFLR